MLLGERVSLQLVEYAVQVQIDALHDEEDIGEIAVEAIRHLSRRDEHVKQFRRKDIIVHLCELAHNHDFSYHLPGFIVIAKHVSYQLNRDNLPSPQVLRLDYLPKSAFTEESNGLVAAAYGLPDCV